MKTILSFIILLVLIVVAVYVCSGLLTIARPDFMQMQPGFLLLSAFSMSFVYVEFINPFKRIKPFNCIKCMNGWIALLLAYLFGVSFWACYFFIGVTMGAIFDRIKMKCL